MRATTLHQPWAHFVIAGYKGIETRKNGLKHPGTMIIHAGQADTEIGRLVYQQAIKEFGLDLPPWEELGFGVILGHAYVSYVRPTVFLEDWLKKKDSTLVHELGHSAAQELAFGDYSYGRKGWRLVDPVRWPAPVPYKGQQGIWQYSGHMPTLDEVLTSKTTTRP